MTKIIQTSGAAPPPSTPAVSSRGKLTAADVAPLGSASSRADRSSLELRAPESGGPSFDAGRVDQLRQLIAAGRYHVNAAATGRALLQQSLDLHGI